MALTGTYGEVLRTYGETGQFFYGGHQPVNGGGHTGHTPGKWTPATLRLEGVWEPSE